MDHEEEQEEQVGGDSVFAFDKSKKSADAGMSSSAAGIAPNTAEHYRTHRAAANSLPLQQTKTTSPRVFYCAPPTTLTWPRRRPKDGYVQHMQRC